MKKKLQATEFLNVDLDLLATAGISDLLLTLGTAVVVLNSTSNSASLELSEQPRSIHAAIDQFVTLIRARPANAERQWRGCQERRFNVGIQGGTAPRMQEFVIPTQSLAGMIAIGAELSITVYAME